MFVEIVELICHQITTASFLFSCVSQQAAGAQQGGRDEGNSSKISSEENVLYSMKLLFHLFFTLASELYMIIILCQISTPLSHVEIYYFLDWYITVNNTINPAGTKSGVTKKGKT